MAFKETEIGLIPEEWEVKKISELVLKIHQGINTTADKIIYSASGYPILQSKHITQGFLNLTDARTISEKIFLKY